MQTKSRLQQAQQRLETALNRLDAALQDRRDNGDRQQDIETLERELEKSRMEEVRLREMTTTIAAKLDDTIERLRRVLDS